MTRTIVVIFQGNEPLRLPPSDFRDAFLRDSERYGTFEQQCEVLHILHPGVRIWEEFS